MTQTWLEHELALSLVEDDKRASMTWLERELTLSLLEDYIRMAALELQVRKLVEKPVVTEEEEKLIDEICEMVA